MEIFIDATNMIAGRMASYAAKRALLGDTVKIFNCENTVITGNRESIIEKHKHRMDLTHRKGPFYPKTADRFVRRIVRGMLPYKQEKGANAFEKVMCYIGVPAEFKDKKLEKVKGADVVERKIARYIKVSEICKIIGGKE